MPSPDPDCVFCKIVAGQIPALTVLDSPDCLAFLDIGPLSAGHFLLIPKTHYTRLDEMPAELGARIGELLPRLAQALQQTVHPEGYNLLQNNGRVAGQVVEHVHFHFIPRVAGDSLGYRWHPDATLHAGDRGPAILQKLRAALND